MQNRGRERYRQNWHLALDNGIEYSALHNKWDLRVSQKVPHLPVIGISVTAVWLHNNPSSTHFHRVREQLTIWLTDKNIRHKLRPHYSYHCTVSSCQNTMDMLTIPTWRWECVWTTGHVTRAVNSLLDTRSCSRRALDHLLQLRSGMGIQNYIRWQVLSEQFHSLLIFYRYCKRVESHGMFDVVLRRGSCSNLPRAVMPEMDGSANKYK